MLKQCLTMLSPSPRRSLGSLPSSGLLRFLTGLEPCNAAAKVHKRHPGGSGKFLSKQKSKDKLKEEPSKAAKAMKAEEPAQLMGALAPKRGPCP